MMKIGRSEYESNYSEVTPSPFYFKSLYRTQQNNYCRLARASATTHYSLELSQVQLIATFRFYQYNCGAEHNPI